VAELWVAQLGTVPYGDGIALQETLRERRQAGQIPDLLLVLEHPPVYTRGRRTEPGDLPMGEDWYRAQGIDVKEVDRGGKVTYHGPGQLVGYPIVGTNLFNSDIPALVGAIEQAMINALAGEGVFAHRDEAGRGVWAGEGPSAGKIGSIGLHISQGVTTHGLMVNVDGDLQPFSWIRPCGLDDQATSISKITHRSGQMSCFSKRIAFATAESFGLRQRIVSRAKLEAAIHDLVLTP
jgi:lipoate-protein ligase B